jgi:hypothetical protein
MASDYRIGDASMVDLLQWSGYLGDPTAVPEKDGEDALRSCPELIVG